MPHRLLLATVVLALSACATEQTESIAVDDAAQLAMIRYEAYYSAFDGVREYRVAPSVSEAALQEDAADPVLEDSLVWKVDAAFATQEPYNKLPGAVLLTTHRAGRTQIEVRGTTMSGRHVRDSVCLWKSRQQPMSSLRWASKRSPQSCQLDPRVRRSV